MRIDLRTVTAACALLLASAGTSLAADVKIHRVSIQVDQNDPAIMNLALNNASNIMETYKEKGEEVEIEVVTYGPGLNMLRDDTSPVKDRLKQIAELSFPSKIKFSACNVTKRGMEKREGHPIPIVAEASLVPSGAVRLMELQESGWSYLKP
ncbi:MAG: DsrE family protein [Bradyrhizobium sp.]